MRPTGVAARCRTFTSMPTLTCPSGNRSAMEAVQAWPGTGVPDNPAGWLRTVATRKAIDRIRRAGSAYRRTLAVARDLLAEPVDGPDPEEDPGEELMIDDDAIRDQQLRLILLCCHPALHPDAQVALTLRLVGGLSTAEIAAGFLAPEATIAQRIVRAKRKIRQARIPLLHEVLLQTERRRIVFVLRGERLEHRALLAPMRDHRRVARMRLRGTHERQRRQYERHGERR